MKKNILVVIAILLAILVLGCNSENETDPKQRHTLSLKQGEEGQLDEIPNGDINISDLLFINEKTTIEELKEKLGTPDAMWPVDTNVLIYYYKLADGGMFSFNATGWQDDVFMMSIISYRDKDIDIIVYASNYVMEHIYDYFPDNKKVMYLSYMVIDNK